MISKPPVVAGLLLGLLASASFGGAPPMTLVAWAPGYPGSTEQAQPTMDDFAGTVARAAGWKAGRVQAVYHETAEGGLALLEGRSEKGDALAIVTLPVYLTYRERLDLRPLLQVVPESGEQETWTLVARREAVGAGAELSGWTLMSMAGFAPRFVRHVALAGMSGVPEDLQISFSPRVLSSLRKAARGDNVVVLLDQAQAAALDSLPFADDLEVVTRSQPMIGSLLCSVGEIGRSEDQEKLIDTMLGLHEGAAGKELLATIRLERFEPVDKDGLDAVTAAHDGQQGEAAGTP